MNDLELAKVVKAARAKLYRSRAGSLHAMWDTIFDAEQILEGKPASVARDDIERYLHEFLS